MYKICIYEDMPCEERYYNNPSSEHATEIHLYSTAEKLKDAWSELLLKHEGETYGVWDDDQCIVAGAFDPGDIDYIEDYMEDMEQGREPEPDELTMRLSHLAGMMESRGEISSSEWDDMSKAIKDVIRAYYSDTRFAMSSSIEEIAGNIFKDRFPASPDKTAGIPNASIHKAEQILVDNGIEKDEASTVLQALGYALLDKELYPEQQTFYFTYGTDEKFPFQRGWTEVHAADRRQAMTLFRREHPDRTPGIVNCADIYTEKYFTDHILPQYKKDIDWCMCHERITPEGVTYPIKENRPDMQQLLHEFSETYSRLYNNPGLYGKEESAAMDAFDKKMKSDPWYKSLVSDFVKARQDLISSDREAAAFELALQACLQRQTQRKPDLDAQMKSAGERAATQQPTTPAKTDLEK